MRLSIPSSAEPAAQSRAERLGRQQEAERLATKLDECEAGPRGDAANVGLHYVTDERPGITRRRAGKGFCYRDPGGQRITDTAVLARIRKLAIPPAYTDLWICPDPNGHIQATGRDARGRKQYRYHPRFREVRDSTKYDHMLAFADALPRMRERITADMSLRGLPREKVLATVVHLLETTMIRVGNADYAKQNKSYGLTTLRDRHVAINGSALRFRFTGKSGKTWRLTIHDRRLARIVKASQDLPGQHLFQYIDEAGEQRAVTSTDVNAYLREISGQSVTAKDFRTWTGTVLAALTLAQCDPAESDAGGRRIVRAAIADVAAQLGNTVAICRKCYIHPEVVAAYLEGALSLKMKAGSGGGLAPEETAVLSFLRARLSRTGTASR